MILIGNIISFIAAVFLFAATWTKDRDRTFLYQIAEALLLALANIFFRSWAGISTLLLAAFRNTLVLKNRYSVKWMCFFVAAVILLGLTVNNRGWIGLLAILATVQLTICNQYMVSLRSVKLSLLVNTLIWLIYDLCILDISSTVAQTITCAGCVTSLLRLSKSGERKK